MVSSKQRHIQQFYIGSQEDKTLLYRATTLVQIQPINVSR